MKLISKFTRIIQALSFQAHFRYVNSFRSLSRRIFHGFYQLAGIMYSVRWILVVLFDKNSVIDWRTKDLLMDLICVQLRLTESYMIIGQAVLVLVDPLIDYFFVNNLFSSHRKLFTDLEFVFCNDYQNIESRILESNPFLTMNHKQNFVALLNSFQRFYLWINLMLVSFYMITAGSATLIIWDLTGSWATFWMLLIDFMILFFVALFAFTEAFFVIFSSLLISLPMEQSLQYASRELSFKDSRFRLSGSNISRILLYTQIQHCHRMHITLKNYAVESIGETIKKVLTGALVLCLLANVIYIIGLNVHEIAITPKVVMITFVALQIGLISVSCWLIAELTKSFYCVNRALARTVVNLLDRKSRSRHQLMRQLKVNTFYEMIFTTEPFCFSIGTARAITKNNIVTFLVYAYPSAIMFMLPIVMRLKNPLF